MIALLRGELVQLGEDHVVVDTGGVGYEVFCHLRTVAALHTERGTEVTLHVHTSVSADAIRLYGFVTDDELRLFRLLIGVERIGPKAALGILGRAELPTLVRAIAEGDVALVATVPGIGRKTAERVIIEMRDSVQKLAVPAAAAGNALGSAASTAQSEAFSALIALGYKPPEVTRLLKSADEPGLSTTEIIRRALKSAAKT
jgi:Holliday junction DNA helicase RuvA